ncbi:glycosyltransferase [Collimonas sp.]|jgi:biofilm PGA synthesis N-glycosyltransferase PgaC|uniref:glycosyltransferase n=1 Tax=Collimonas sp. TaxID=1963772 RepID=UPI002BEBB541|nr:glycosyltransferase [Collimonas sp.]HWW06781.1 glycosyltransferase [Collimonas sp.]
MTDLLLSPLLLFGAVTFYFGLLSLAYFPLAFSYPFWERRLMARARAANYMPRVSVLVPAYNEERTICLSVQSILDSDYPDFEVIVINDGSTDATASEIQPFINAGLIRYRAKRNGGKASALNAGIALASGDIILFSDADSIFEKDTIRNGVAYFADPEIGALSGNDTPLNPRGALQKLMVVTSHIGTGFVRRALSMARILPIIPGNLGMVRTNILRAIGGFREVWGEDLELTLRLHRYGVRIVYGASTKVIAECPHTLRGLWRQRVRWIRSYICVMRMHRDMIGHPKFGGFGLYLLLNLFNMVVIPVLQALNLLLLPAALHAGMVNVQNMEWVAYLGFGSLLTVAVTAILLDKSLRDLMFLPYTLVLLPLSYFYTAVVIYSIWAEARAHATDWNKLERRNPNQPPMVEDPWRRRLVLGGVTVAGLAAATSVMQIDADDLNQIGQMFEPEKPVGGNLTVSIHFSDWPDWRQALQWFLQSSGAKHVDRVAISAGRPDWTFYKWPGHEQWWSPEQHDAEVDLLGETIAALAARGYKTTATLDALAPRYLQLNPQFAAVDVKGKHSRDVVCSTCLANGEYGELFDAAFRSLAAKTEVDSICITEMFYDVHCYDERCRASFAEASGRSDWPRHFGGRIDRQHPAIGKWRSEQVARTVARLSAIAGTHGKQLLMDVRVSRDNLTRNSSENGQDYRLLLPLVDQLVVWDYFAIDRLPPRVAGKVARYLSRNFGADRYWHSIGLWDDKGGSIDAEQMAHAIRAARRAGSKNIWITPGKDLTASHWQALEKLELGKDYPDRA